MANLFIIRSPLQLLSAKEAVLKFKLKNNYLVVIETKNLSNTSQIDLLVSKKDWKSIIRLKTTNKSNFFNYIELIKELKTKEYKYVFFGDYGSIFEIIHSNIKSNNFFLIDDGTITIDRYNKFKNNKISIKKELKRKLRYLLFGLKIKRNKNLNFFTMFNLEPFSSFDIINHNFESLKNEYNLEEKPFSNEVYIIGQPYVSDGYLKKELYFKYISYLCKIYSKEYQINYLLHRGEHLNYLEKEFTNINFIKSEVPAEILFINMEKKPKYVVGLTSTLLFSLNSIFDDVDITSYKIKENDFLLESDIHSNLYTYIEKNNIKINSSWENYE